MRRQHRVKIYATSVEPGIIGVQDRGMFVLRSARELGRALGMSKKDL
jgi:hypothetical protein